MHQWVNLTSRHGETIQSPSKAQMEETLQDLFTAEIDNEHPDCWIECGTQTGELHSLIVFQSGYAIYTQYSDFDMSEEIQSRELRPIDFNSALELWSKLIENGTCSV
jgi:hypothetical protein